MKGKEILEKNPNINPLSPLASTSSVPTIPSSSNTNNNSSGASNTNGLNKSISIHRLNSNTNNSISLDNNSSNSTASLVSPKSIESPQSPLSYPHANKTNSNISVSNSSSNSPTYASIPNSTGQSLELGSTKSLPLKFLPVENSIITVMFDRIDLLLPYKSGYSIPQVLADPCYIQTKSHLLKLADSNLFLQDLISCIYNIFIKILEKDNSNSKTLYSKSLNILNSIYLMVFFLSNFLNSFKAKESLEHLSGKIFKDAGMKTTPRLFYKNHLSSKPLNSLNPAIASKFLSLLTSLKNDNTCLSTIFDITDNSLENFSNLNINNATNTSLTHNFTLNHNYLALHKLSSNYNNNNTTVEGSLPSSNSSSHSSNSSFYTSSINLQSKDESYNDHMESKKLLLEKITLSNYETVNMIDENISSILIYLAASNPSQYLEYERTIFRRFNLESLFIKGSHIIKFAFLSSSNFSQYCVFVKDLLYLTKRSSQQSLILYFFHEAILSWALNRSSDFLKAIDNNLCSKNADVLFDILIKLLDPKYCPKVYYGILSSLLFFQSKQLNRFITDKLSTNKFSTTKVLKKSISTVTKMNISGKQKFLSDFSQLVEKHPEFSQSLISFLLVGCSISVYNNEHALYKFVLLMKDHLVKQLKLEDFDVSENIITANPNTSSQSINETSVLIKSNTKLGQQLRVGVFAILSIVNTTGLSQKLVYVLNNSDDALSLLPLITGGFRLLIGIPSLSQTAFLCIEDLSPILIKVTSILSDSLTTPYISNNNGNVVRDFDYGNKNEHQVNSPDDKISFKSQSSLRTGSIPYTPIKQLSNASSPALKPQTAPFKTTPLKLSEITDISSIDSYGSSDNDLNPPYFKLSSTSFALKEKVNFIKLEKQISRADPALIKQNVINLLMIYSYYSFLCYTNLDINGVIALTSFVKSFKRFIDKVINLLYLDDKQIIEATESLLLSFCITVANKVPLRVFAAYIATSILIDSVSAVAISPNIHTDKRNKLIRLILDLLEERSENSDLAFMYEHKDLILKVHEGNICHKIIKNFEQVVFLGLFSNSIETIRASKRLLQFYVFVITNTHHLPTCFNNSNLELATDILSDKMTFGILSIRKKIRDRLCHLKEPTDTLLNIWSLMYEKVAITYGYDKGPNINSSIEEVEEFMSKHKIIEEIDIASEYIASLGGIIMAPSFRNDPRQPTMRKHLELFLGNKFISLFSGDTKKRENSREILSVSIHPYNCEILIEQTKMVLPRFEYVLNQEKYNICELFLSVLRAICQIESKALFPFAVNLWDINITLLKMLNVENNSPDFLRLKLKFCKLQVLFLSKLDELSLNGNIYKKNEYARYAAEYLEYSFATEKEEKPLSNTKVLSFISSTKKKSNKMSNKLKEFKESELKDLHLDIKVEVSHMLKLVFYRLPLDTPRHNGNLEEEKSAASVVFSNYFNLFVRLLEKLNDLKRDEDSHLAIVHRSSSIIKGIIQALTNLLNANPSIGLNFSIPLGYHTDQLIRISFIDVFSKIIKDIYSSYKKKVSKNLLYDRCHEIITEDISFFLSSASCCPKSEIEPFASSILQLKINDKLKLKLLLSLIRFDVLNTSDKNEILRSNTVGTRVTALYSHDNAGDYLVSIFRPIFTEMIEKKEYFEIEKIGTKSEEDTTKNLALFYKYLNRVSDSILDSIDRMPIGLRLIAKTIYDATSEVMPEIKFVAINAYLFLRLFNPTIVTPERSGIVKCSDLLFKRSLIQLARVIQTIVNETPVRVPILESQGDNLLYAKNNFFKFMKKVVDFDMDDFDSLDIEEKSDEEETLKLSKDNFEKHDDEIDFKNQNSDLYLHGYFYDNWMNIRQTYLHHSDSFDASFKKDVSLEKKMEAVKTFDHILLELGLPKRVKGFQIPESIKSDKSPRGVLLYDFMSKISLNMTNDHSFINVLITKDGLPLICINSLNFPETLTAESYAYIFLQTLTKFWEASYCLLIDLTAFRNFDLLMAARAMIHSMIGSQYKANCKRMYYVNMSTYFFMRFKSVDINYSNEDRDVNPEYVFVSTNDDNKSMSNNKLMNYYNSVSDDNRVVFKDVSLYQEENKRFIPVKLKIGNHFIQITSAMPQRIKLLNKMYVVNLVDCFKIDKLTNIAPSNYTGVSNEISMVDIKTKQKIVLTSSKKIEIMRTLYFSRARLNNNDYAEDDLSVASSPKFTVGHLLNISFLGLLSKSGDIRTSSYALLASVQQSVGLKTGKNIDSIEGVVFPYGDIDYVASVSASIAENHPSLTYAFIYGLFTAYDKICEEDKNSMILCISPWVKNIYSSVYLSDSLRGPGRTYDIIRKFVRASRHQQSFQVFSLFVWPQLSLEDGLIEIIIDEIVAASIDHEAEGHDWQGITKYWPLRSSIEICSVVIKRMKEKSFSMSYNESEIEAHTRWIETTVLVRFLSYLMFDSLLFVDRYISDIFYIVTIYMDHGPLELRKCLLYLLTRTFHSYLSKPSLTIAQHVLIKKQIELLNGARFRMLFGLTREDDDRRFKLQKIVGSDIISRANAVTTLCDLLTSFLHDYLDSDEYELQMIKWNLNVCKLAFDETRQLQSRAILVMGSLTKQGISDSLLFKVITLLETKAYNYVNSTVEDIPKNLTSMICALHAFGKAINGIDKSSKFHPMIFWFHVTLLLFDNVSFFQYGAEYIQTTLEIINEHVKENNLKLVDYLFEYKFVLNDLIIMAEEEFGIRITKSNFDVVLILLFGKGLESPFSYNTAIDTIKVVLKIRYQEYLKSGNEDIDYQCYLFFIYLTSNNNEEMLKILDYCEFDNCEFVASANNCLIPKILLEWFNKENLNVFSACLGASNYFIKQKLDELASTRVILLYVEVYKINSEIILKLFNKVDRVLKKFVSTSSTPNLLEIVLDMIVTLMSKPEFATMKFSEEKCLQILFDNNLGGISNLTFTINNPNSEAALVVPIEVKKRRLAFSQKILDRIQEILKKDVMTKTIHEQFEDKT